MYHRLCDRLAIDTAGSVGQSPEYSRAIDMAGGNAVQWEAVVFYLDRDGLIFRLQVSEDLEVWQDVGSNQPMNTIGYKLFTAETQIAAPYVRLRYSVAVSGKAVLAAGIYVSKQ